MIVFVPDPKHPLAGQWLDLPRQQKVHPSAIRAIWRARTHTKYHGAGIPLPLAKEEAAQDTAFMLGLPLTTIRAFCNLNRKRKGRRPAKVLPQSRTLDMPAGTATRGSSLCWPPK